MFVKLTTANFINKAIAIHGNRYDYSSTIYFGRREKIDIICRLHGKFTSTAKIHLEGGNCKYCIFEESKINQSKGNDQFIKEARFIHGDKYDYSKVNYINCKIEVEIICNNCKNTFYQIPNNHILYGNGCRSCSIKNRTKKLPEFISQANLVHNNKYDYSKVIYKNTGIKVIIICPYHGEFEQTPTSHIDSKSGCPSCFNRTSFSEREWLDYCDVPDNKDCRQVKIIASGKNFTVDGFVKETNTVYEYYGDIWHGNPLKYNKEDINPASKISYGVLYDKTVERENLIKQAGYKLITIWGSEWMTFKQIERIEV